MSRIATLADSFGVGSIHVGLRDLSGRETRATFQFYSDGPFAAEIRATNDFDFVTNVGTHWVNVTERVFAQDDDPDFVKVGDFHQRRKPGKNVEINVPGLYAMDDGFMPAAFQVNVTSMTSGSPLSIFFGV